MLSKRRELDRQREIHGQDHGILQPPHDTLDAANPHLTERVLQRCIVCGEWPQSNGECAGLCTRAEQDAKALADRQRAAQDYYSGRDCNELVPEGRT